MKALAIAFRDNENRTHLRATLWAAGELSNRCASSPASLFPDSQHRTHFFRL